MKQVFCKYKDAFAGIEPSAGTGHEACAQCGLPEQHPEFWDSHQRTIRVAKLDQKGKVLGYARATAQGTYPAEWETMPTDKEIRQWS